jgi:glycosyltransferase involved in cell wall biosynthesis
MNASEPDLSQRHALPESLRRNPIAATVTHKPDLHHAPATTRTLFVINSLEGGGAERVFSTVVNGIGNYLTQTSVEVLLLDDKPARFEIAPTIDVASLHSSGSLLDSAVRFARHVARRRPHVVVSFLPRANYIAALFAPLFGYRCIISERSDTNGRLGAGIAGATERQLLKLLYPRAHHIICVAEAIRQRMVSDYGIAESDACAIYNPVDVERIRQLAQEPCALQQDPRLRNGFILAAGRLADVKRFDVLIRACARGDFRLPLVILGEGPRLSELQHLARSLGIAQRVLFTGFVPNPYPAMAKASVFVLSSQREGFPNALVEAMALACPVIATNCHHGPAEILDDAPLAAFNGVHEARHGLMVPVGDVDALTEALRKVLGNDTLRATLARKSARRAAHFSAATAIGRYAAVIGDQLALATRQRGQP